MNIQNKTILITGGARIGQTVAEELQHAGATVIMTYLKSPDEALAGVTAYPADLTQETSIDELLKTVETNHGAIDGLVNMASIFSKDPASPALADFQKSFAIMFGNMLLSRRFAEAARERDAKAAPIVSFIDWAVDHPYAGYDMYLAGKAALRHYLMALQTSFAGSIRVVNIHPGMILEPANFSADEKEKIIANTPTHSIGDPQQAARLVRTALENDFLADNIHLDGGQSWRHRL